MDPHGQRNFDDVLWFLLIGIFAMWGALAKLLSRWRPMSAPMLIGKLMASVFAAWLSGLASWDMRGNYPHLALLGAGLAAWLGEEIVDWWSRRLIRPDEDIHG